MDDGENVGEATPHKLVYANLSASENLSLSQYLSNSFQRRQSISLKQQLQTMTKSSCLLTNASNLSGGAVNEKNKQI